MNTAENDYLRLRPRRLPAQIQGIAEKIRHQLNLLDLVIVVEENGFSALLELENFPFKTGEGHG